MDDMGASYEARTVNQNGEPLKKSRYETLDLPARFEIRDTNSEAGSPISDYSFFIEVDQSGDSMEISELTIKRFGLAPAITTTTLREIPITDFLAVCRMSLGATGESRTFGEPWGNWGTYSLVDEYDILRRMSLDQMKNGGLKDFPPLVERGGEFIIEDEDFLTNLRKLGPSHEKVQTTIKWLYTFAEMKNLAPVGFIKSTLGIPSSTASHWVKLARQSGALPPTVRRSRTARGK